jgi:CDP-glycerol glycerophosphotransferase (TagB/SpsB family)
MVIPRTRKIIVFGSAHGYFFNDNSKYLFLQMHYSHHDKKLVWITKNEKILKNLKSHHLCVARSLSPKGIWYQLRAATCFYSHRLTDLEPLFLGGAKKFSLFHSIIIKVLGPEVDWGENFKDRFNRWLSKVFRYSYYYHMDFILNPMPAFDKYYKRVFSVSKPQIVHASQPRVDYFMDDINNKEFVFDDQYSQFLENLEKFDFVISWLPTHRVYKNQSIFEHIKGISEHLQTLSALLRENNAGMVLKPHPLELAAIEQNLPLPENFLLLGTDDPYPLLKKTDLLITDYSSVVFDFYMKSNKILFYCFDLSEYLQDVGLFEPLDKVFEGGEIITSFQNLLEKIEEYMKTPAGCKLKYSCVSNRVIDSDFV